MNTIVTVKTAREKLIYTLFSTTSGDIVTYGIKVDSKLFGDESDTLNDISSDIFFAQKLLFILAENCVLPSTFKEVVEEYVSSAYTI